MLRVNRKGYVRKGGVRVKGTTFKIRDRGARGRGEKVIVAKKRGVLTAFGYHYSDPDSKRHTALQRIAADVKKGGVTTKEEQRVLGRVGAGAVWFKKTNPVYARRASADKKFLSKLIETD